MKKLLLIVVLIFGYLFTFSQEIKKISITELESYISNSNKPLIINFWATFCVPCVKEIPYFQSIIKDEYPGKVELLLVSLDLPSSYPSNISSFAKKKKFYSHRISSRLQYQIISKISHHYATIFSASNFSRQNECRQSVPDPLKTHFF